MRVCRGDFLNMCLCVIAACQRAREVESQRLMAEQERAKQVEMALERERAGAENQRILEARRLQEQAEAERRHQEELDRQLREQQQRILDEQNRKAEIQRARIRQLQHQQPVHHHKRKNCAIS